MLNEPAVYESKQILDQSTQPCFHVILHVDSGMKSNSAAWASKLHYLLILPLPPYNFPASYLTKFFNIHSPLWLNNFTCCLRHLISLFKTLPLSLIAFFQNIGGPSVSDHSLWEYHTFCPVDIRLGRLTIWLALTSKKWVEVMWEEASRGIACFHYLFFLFHKTRYKLLCQLWPWSENVAAGRQKCEWETVLCSGYPLRY